MGREKEEIDFDGIIFLSGKVSQESAEKVCTQIIKMNQADEVPWIQMIVNSQGGYCSAGFAIIDVMEWSRLPIFTTGIGMVASMGLLIFMSGETGRRVLTPRTSILSHRYSAAAIGNHSQLVASRKEQDLMHDRIVNHYIEHSNIKNEKELDEILLRDVDTWLSPQEAIDHGLADVLEHTGKRARPEPARGKTGAGSKTRDRKEVG